MLRSWTVDREEFITQLYCPVPESLAPLISRCHLLKNYQMAPAVFQLFDLGQIFGAHPPKSSTVDLIIILTYVYNSPAYKLPFCLVNWAAPLFISCMTDSFQSYEHLNRHFFIFLDTYLSFSDTDYSLAEEFFSMREEIASLLTKIYPQATDHQITNQLNAIRGMSGSRSRSLQIAITSSGLLEFLIDCSMNSYPERSKTIIQILENLLELQRWTDHLAKEGQNLIDIALESVLEGGATMQIGLQFLKKLLLADIGRPTTRYLMKRGYVLRELLQNVRADWPGKLLYDVLVVARLFYDFGERVFQEGLSNRNVIVEAVAKDDQAIQAIETIIEDSDPEISRRWSYFYENLLDQKHRSDMEIEDNWGQYSDF